MSAPDSDEGRYAAVLVHIFTSLGAVAALFAVLAISQRAYELAFAWLGVALFIDGVDGTLARAAGVKERLPRFSGETLDLVIDYLTYVFVPVLALLSAGYLSGGWGLILGAGILVSSLFHFSDAQSKAADHCFVGFPAIWNAVAFYIFAFQPASWVVWSLICICVALTFVHMSWIHPLRVVRLRKLTLAMVAIWTVAAISVLIVGFPATGLARGALLAIAIYGCTLSLFWWRISGGLERGRKGRG